MRHSWPFLDLAAVQRWTSRCGQERQGRERERELELLLTAIASQHRNSGVVAQGGVSSVFEALQAKASKTCQR